MDYNVWKVAGVVAGIGGIAIAAVVFIFREVIRRQIFPQLTKKQAHQLLNKIITYTFIIGIVGILSYFVISLHNARSDSNPKSQYPSPTPLSNITNTQKPSPEPSKAIETQKTEETSAPSETVLPKTQQDRLDYKSADVIKPKGGQKKIEKPFIIHQTNSNTNPSDN